MCGIAGIQQFNGQPVRREMLERMTAVLEHRGPDANGVGAVWSSAFLSWSDRTTKSGRSPNHVVV